MKKGPLLLFLLFFSSLAHATDLGKGRDGDMLFVHHAPDPVNTRTGNFFLPLQDYYMPCFNYPLEVYRSYNSFSTKNGPFGHGWTFNYDIQIVVGQQDGLKIVEADGFVNEYLPVENKYQSQKEIVTQIITKKKAEDIRYSKNKDGKGTSHYADLEKKLLNEPAYYQTLKNRYIKTSSLSPSGRYVSKNRGTSYLTKKGNRFTRENEIGQIETYNEKGLMIKIEDRNSNTLRFAYDSASRLHRIYDGCSNHIQISYNKSNKITSVLDTFQRKLNYTYDEKLRLISFTGLDKKTMQYAYDSFNRMTSVTFEDGTQTVIAYTKNGRVASQKGPGPKHSTFTYGKDGNAIWTKVKESGKGVHQYKYIDIENKIIHTDPANETTTTVLSSCCGKPISIKSSTGINDIFEYDSQGNLQSRTNAAGEKTTFRYEPRYQSIADITESNGRVLRYRYDRKGNLTFAQALQGKQKEHLKISYESHGKIRHMIDHLGTEIMFDYAETGKIASIIKKMNGTLKAKIHFTYDKSGQSIDVVFSPNKPATSQEIATTLQNFMLLLAPTGIDFEI